MITRAGALLLVAAVALAAGGRGLGLVELHVLAGAAAGAVVASLAWVATRDPVPVAVARTVHPARVHVGSPAHVEVAVTSTSRRPTPVLTLADPIDGRRGARLQVAPVPVGGSVRAGYRLPTTARGELGLGPLGLEVVDPLGLARRRTTVAGRVRLVVLPHVDAIPATGSPGGSDPLTGHEGRAVAGGGGDEYHSLRDYVVGDDIRRVHWPASARAGDLVVRQDEDPREGRLTVGLDLARTTTTPAGFERMVSAAASVAAAHRARGDIVRLVTGDGADTGWVNGEAAFQALLEVLALVRRTPRSDVGRALAVAEGGADAVVVIAGDLADAGVAALPGRRAVRTGRHAGLTVVRFLSAPAPEAVRGIEGARVVDVDPWQDFPSRWREGLARPQGRRPAGRVP